MKALVVAAFGAPPEVREVDEPTCPPDGVVIEVRATGLCRSDWHGWAGHDADIRLPHVPGHEFAGVVIAFGPQVTRARMGQRVTAPFVCACGSCATCRAGAPQVCENQFQPGFTGWGSFAEQVAIPHADINLVPLPDAVAFGTAASLGCRFATAYRAVVAHGRVRADEWVAVFGCGGVGLSATMIAAARGGRVVAVDVASAALELASRVGAELTLDANDPDLIPRIRAATGGGVHLSLDALGSEQTCRSGIESLRRRGRHVQVGLMVGPDASTRIPMDRVISHELEVYGSHGMAAADYPAMLAEIADGILRPGDLVISEVGLANLAGSNGTLARMGHEPPTGITVVTF